MTPTKLLPWNPVSRPEATLVKYYDRRLTRLQRRYDGARSVLFVVMVTIIVCVLLSFINGADAYIPNHDCNTDTECQELYGGDGGPAPNTQLMYEILDEYDWENRVFYTRD